MESLLPKGGLGFHNTTPPPFCQRHEQKLFHWQTISLHDVSHYHGMAFGCYKNPYLSLSNLHCGFCLSRPSLAAIDLAKRRAVLRGIRAWISTPGFENIKSVSYLSHEWEVRGWAMSEMQTHSHLNTASDVENERRRGTWMKGEASHHGAGWNRHRARGSVRERKKWDDYLRNFVRRRRWLPAHVWTLFWQQCLRQKQSWWDLWVVLVCVLISKMCQ